MNRLRLPVAHRLVRLTAGALALALGGGTGVSAQEPAAPAVRELHQELRQLVAAARDQVFPALVNIEVVTVQHYGGEAYKGRSVGSGTIISSEGHVLTNYHVTAGGESFRCTLADREELDAELVGEDPLTDLAVLRLDLTGRDPAAGPLPVAAFGSSSELEVGDSVLAMGSPFALSRSVTLGIVSNLERVLWGGPWGGDPDEMLIEEGQRTGLFTRWIQHDALINPGNSGGPLVDLAGRVVGVNELGGGALGFAIPSDLAQEVAADLIARGEVPRSWIGASLKPIQGTGHERGVLVDSIVEGGPAAQAGLAAGDLLTGLGGAEVTVRFPEEVPILAKRIADLPVGAEVEVAYQRDGSRGIARVITAPLEKDKGEEVELRAWGLTAQAITSKMARDLRLPHRQGALVSGVRSGGPGQLAEPPLVEGDVIRAVAGRSVEDLEALVEAYREATDAETPEEDLLVELDRAGKSFLTLLSPRNDSERDPPRELPKAWIGVATQPVTSELARRLGAPGGGFRVTRVYPGTEAASALQVGDVILSLEGEDLEPRGGEDAGLFERRVRRLRLGGTARVRVLRDGAVEELQVTLERSRLTPEEARRDRNRDFELVVRELTFFDRDERRWDPEVRGVLVEAVEPAGWAGIGGLRPFDLIQRIGDREVHDLAGYRRALESATAGRPERVVMVVLRGVRTHFLFLEPEWGPDDPDD